MSQLTRRALLAAAGSSVALPWLRASAQPTPGTGTSGPQRLIVIYSPNGFLRDAWLPTAVVSPTSFQLGPTMQPLLSHRDDLVIIDGLENRAAIAGQGPSVERGMATLLTGTDLANGATTGFVSGGGISLDQAIGSVVSGAMILPPLVLGLGVSGGLSATLATPSYSASRAPVSPVSELGGVAAKLFPANMMPGPQSEAGLRLALNRIAVSASQKNLAFLRARVGNQDRLRLDAHSQGLKELLGRIDAQQATCSAPPSPASMGRDATRLFDVGLNCLDLVVAAFACDRARVATLVWEGAEGNARFSPNAAAGHHDLAVAAAAGDAKARASLQMLETQFMQSLGYLLDALAQRSDGAGSLLDSTLVLVCSDVASAKPASWQNMPCLLAGRAGGRLKTGRFLRVPGAPWNQLLISILGMFGAGNKFGNPKYGTGPLPGL